MPVFSLPAAMWRGQIQCQKLSVSECNKKRRRRLEKRSRSRVQGYVKKGLGADDFLSACVWVSVCVCTTNNEPRIKRMQIRRWIRKIDEARKMQIQRERDMSFASMRVCVRVCLRVCAMCGVTKWRQQIKGLNLKHGCHKGTQGTRTENKWRKI